MPEEPVFTLDEVVDLERPALHRNAAGSIDFIYDGITFWHGEVGHSWSVENAGPLPTEGWHHKRSCKCARCRGARMQRRKRG
jgi:hypothetical protein